MKMPGKNCLLAAASLLLTLGTTAWAGPGFDAAFERVSDASLTLPDIAGTARQPLKADKDATGMLLIFVLQDCPISNSYAPEYQRLFTDYAEKGIRMCLVYTDEEVTLTDIKKHRSQYQLEGITAIHDARHQLVKATGATVTPEAALIQPDGRIAYRGRIDNLYPDFGKKRRAATVHELRDALDAVLAGKPVVASRTKAIGCFIPPLDEE